VLEKDPRFQETWEIKREMDRSAWAAFMKEANPENPDIAKLIAEELARRAAEETGDEE
jgi:hypothetical protein